MRLRWGPLRLRLRRTFRTAHGASDERHNLVLAVSHQGLCGWGEAAGLAYLGEQPQQMQAVLRWAAAELRGADLATPQAVASFLARLPRGSAAVAAALDMALHDLLGQRCGCSVRQLLGLGQVSLPQTSFTISLDAPEAMAHEAATCNMPLLKVKLGGAQDLQVVQAIRRAAPAARLRVDANAGWSRQRAAALIPQLAQLGVELVEQPLPEDDLDGLRWLRSQQLGLPLFADESARGPEELPRLAGLVDGVVLKLMKCGGLARGRELLQLAAGNGLQVMVSCMVESSLAVTAAAQLCAGAHLVDLDGPLLLLRDPFVGLAYDGATLRLPRGPGLGVRPRSPELQPDALPEPLR